MFVFKRDGRREDVKFDKITSRINKLCYGLDNRFVDSAKISQKVKMAKDSTVFEKKSFLQTKNTRNKVVKGRYY